MRDDLFSKILCRGDGPEHSLKGLRQFPTFVLQELSLQRQDLLLWLPVFMGAGIAVYFTLKSEPHFAVLSAVFILAALLFGLFYVWAQRDERQAIWRDVILLGMMFIFGAALAQWRTAYVEAPVLKKKMSPVSVEGTIENIDRLSLKDGSRLILRDLQIERVDTEDTPKKVRIKVRDDSGLEIGDRVKILAGLNPPSAPVAPDAFDFQRYAFFRQIGAFGFAYNMPEVLKSGDERQRRLLPDFEPVRLKIVHRIDAALPAEQAAVLSAVITGERAAIPEKAQDAIRDAGLAHMLAISGLHVGLVAGLIFFFSRFIMALFPNFAVHHPIKKYAAAVALCGAVFYTLLVGMPITAFRALLMTGLVLVAVMLDRVAISLRMVALAALIVMIFSPEAVLGASFQMSFAAVGALVAFYEYTRPFWQRMNRGASAIKKVFLYVQGVTVTTIVASIATAPFALYHFQHLAVLSLPANIVAMPLLAFVVMPAAIVAGLLVPLSALTDMGLDVPFWIVSGWGVQGILDVSYWTADLPHAVFSPSVWPAGGFAFMVASGIWMMLWRGHLRVISFVLFTAACLQISFYKKPDMLISSSGKLAAIRGHEGQLYVSSWMQDRFTGEVWARREGKGKQKLPKWKDLEGMNCDEYGCYYRDLSSGTRIALSEHPASHAQDCALADIVIANDPVNSKKCDAPVIIDWFDLWRYGSYAVWLGSEKDDGRVKILSVADRRGQRPWVHAQHR